MMDSSGSGKGQQEDSCEHVSSGSIKGRNILISLTTTGFYIRTPYHILHCLSVAMPTQCDIAIMVYARRSAIQ